MAFARACVPKSKEDYLQALFSKDYPTFMDRTVLAHKADKITLKTIQTSYQMKLVPQHTYTLRNFL